MDQSGLSKSVLALDIGESRVGVARASVIAKIASPLTTLANGPDFFNELRQIIKDNAADLIVVGWPRSLSGEPTKQTGYVEDFVEQLKREVGLEIKLQDEALTSVKAKAELDSRKKDYAKSEIDALAACYILDDYLNGPV